jgi:glycosyltransferase involved in cell wall biosynthesis
VKIHYHSDCPFFAGCEKMLVNFWTDPRLRRRHEISFSYRRSAEYTSGLDKQWTPDCPVFPVFPLSLPVQNLPVRNFNLRPKVISRIVRLMFRLITKIPFLIFDVVILTRLLRQVAPDVVHINNGGYPAARSARAAAIAARLAGVKKVVMVVNNLAVGYTGPERWLDFPIDRLVAKAVDRFVTGSRAAANRLQEVLPLKSGQAQSIHNGIRSRPLTEPADQVRRRLGVDPRFNGIVIGVVALMEPRKGHRVLLEALALLLKREPILAEKIVVWLEGDGPLRGELESLVRIKNLSSVVRFIGREKNVADMMNALDILVLPSVDSEDFPNVTLEAMQLRKTVVASALAGTPEQILDEETGLLVAPGNAEALAKALGRLIEQPEWARRLGAKGQERFSNMFRAETAVKNYLDLYHSL